MAKEIFVKVIDSCYGENNLDYHYGSIYPYKKEAESQSKEAQVTMEARLSHKKMETMRKGAVDSLKNLGRQ